MAAAADRDASKKVADRVSYPMGITKIYKGTLVSLRSDGFAYPARNGTAGDIFIGVARGFVDNSAGAAGDKSVMIDKVGSHIFALSTAVQADFISPMYASDDQTLTRTSTNAQLVGYPCELIDSGHIRIRIDNAVK